MTLNGITRNFTGGATPATALVIGGQGGTTRYKGPVANFAVYSDEAKDPSNLIHFWAIDDNVEDGGTIIDSVGGDNGTLTLGSGEWKQAP